MSIEKLKERPLEKVDLQLLMQMADVEELPLVMLRLLHDEICLRRVPGWKTMQSSLCQRYSASKQKELEKELAEMYELASDQKPEQQQSLEPVAADRTPSKSHDQKSSLQQLPNSNSPRVHIVKPSTKNLPKPPETWEEAAKLVRHAKVHADTRDLENRLRASRDWAQISPLRLLGYSVNATDGLNLTERREFLKDFCETAILPKSLPKEYATSWDEPGTRGRALRTARHLQFLIKTFGQRNDKAYEAAIAAWEQDWRYLREQFDRLASVSDWLATRH